MGSLITGVLLHYQNKLQALEAGAAKLQQQHNAAALVLAIATALFLLAGFAVLRKQVSVSWLSPPLIASVFSERTLRRSRRDRLRTSRLHRFYERSVARVTGKWTGVGATGEAFNTAAHRYAADLNIFGEGSLFQLLCTARTGVGERGLADYLTGFATLEESFARQQAVRELQSRTDLRERVAALGRYDFLQSKWGTFEAWLNSELTFSSRSLRICLACTTAVLAALLLAGATGILAGNTIALYTAPLMVFHTAVGLRFRNRINQLQTWLFPVATETQLLSESLRFLEREPFESAKLQTLSTETQGAATSIASLGRILHALHERQKEWFYLPGLLFMAGTQLSLAAEEWRRRHATDLRRWLKVWAEFEALNSLGGYAFENPDNTYPELTNAGPCFKAQAMEHPLIHRGFAVPNAIAFDDTVRFAVISGSNMSGKSTLLRALGLNAVLAFAGAPVRASSLTLSQLEIHASLSLTDSLLNGASKFRIEVNRLQETLESARSGNKVLFLVDEIFSGTNSRDRRIAAEAVIRTLLDRGAIGALSTHDLSLCEIPSDSTLRGINLHLGSSEGGGPLDFDYHLKPGVTNESNALAIARLAGVPV